MRHSLARLAAIVLSLAGATQTASALESGQVTTGRTRASLITDTDAAQPGHPIQAALYLRLAPGWHTYWRNPGDAGIAPQLAVQLPPDSSAGAIEWPLPERIAEGDLTTFAYRGDVTLPFTVMPGTMPLVLQAHADWLVCRDICVPEQADFVLNLPAGPAAPSPQAPLIAEAGAHVPQPAPFSTTIASDGTLTLSGTGLPGDVTRVEFFPYGDGEVETAGAQAPRVYASGLTLRIALRHPRPASSALQGVVRLTRADGTSQAFTTVAHPSAAAQAGLTQPVLPLLLAAFAGGLLLNLMPCVFPVLAIKALALARLSGVDRRTIRIEAASYTLGVITCFVALGSILVALRGAGHTVGWGFQLQSPIFVTAVAWLLFATGLNLSGVFAVGGRLSNAGHSLTAAPGWLGSFFTGLLAVIVATPCTAAFMGAALAGALAASAPTAIAVFVTMGLGLATPYAAIALVPRLTGMLPRPGRWMETLRQALAFPMYGAAVWLLWVVSQQSGPTGVLTAATGLLIVGFAAWTLGLAQASTGRRRLLGYGGSAAGLLAMLTLLTGVTAAATEPSEPFSQARLAELRGQGRPVFVNMTAAWCLSCLVNERLALSPTAVRAAFASANVAYLKGDWTRQNPAISAFLRENDRDGVPLYVFYPPGGAPVVLPQILSESAVLAQVDRLGG